MRILAAAFLSAALAAPSIARDAAAPDILVLGDSQLSFGLGPAMLDLLGDLDARCAALGEAPPLGGDSVTVGVLGVRSTAPHSWAARPRKGKRFICEKDQTWGSNAAVYGALAPDGVKWRQVGEGPLKPICAAGRAPLAALLAEPRFKPKLIVMMFMGNAVFRWADSPTRAAEDARETAALLPADIGCVFATTAPSFEAKRNRRRLKAQAAIRAGVAAAAACEPVDGLTAATIAAIEGNAPAFRRNRAGAVIDAHHPTELGAQLWLDAVAPRFCRAIARAWRRAAPASIE